MFVQVPLESRLLLSAASLLVPPAERLEWRREWDGEIWWWIVTQPGAGRAAAERVTLAVHCWGAVKDAFCLCQQHQDRTARLRAAFSGPGALLAGAITLIALIAFLSAGFQNTTRALRAAIHPRNSALAILSQTDLFMGLQFGVPPRKVDYWSRNSNTVQEIALYGFYSGVVRLDPSHSRLVPAARVGPGFFSLLGAKAQMGRIFAEDDVLSCRSCVVAGYEFWKRHLRADRHVVGRTVIIDERAFRVIGVLQRDFWFLGQHPAVWSLADQTTDRSIPFSDTGALCRLRPGFAPLTAERELRTLAREAAPTESGSRVTVNLLDSIVSRPIRSLGPLYIGFIALALICALGKLNSRGVRTAEAFFLVKSVVLVNAVFLAAFESGAAASINRLGGPSVVAGTAPYWLSIAAAICLSWAWNDHRKRCRTCLRRLMPPVRIGEGSRILLEPGGTEMACPFGHGILFTSELDSVAPKRSWYPLDVSWCERLGPTAALQGDLK